MGINSRFNALYGLEEIEKEAQNGIEKGPEITKYGREISEAQPLAQKRKNKNKRTQDHDDERNIEKKNMENNNEANENKDRGETSKRAYE